MNSIKRKVARKIKRIRGCYYRMIGLNVGSHASIGKHLEIIGAHCIRIGDYFRVGDFAKIQAWEHYKGKETGFNPLIIIGDNVSLMDNVLISALQGVEIGSGSLIGDNVLITDNSHGNWLCASELKEAPLERTLYSKGTIKIGKNVWIGRNACIMGGVRIGNGAVVGANAVVTKDIPDYSCAVGVPIRIISKYGEEEVNG